MAEGRRRDQWDQTSYIFYGLRSLLHALACAFGDGKNNPEPPQLFEMHPLRKIEAPKEFNDPFFNRIMSLQNLPAGPREAAFKDLLKRREQLANNG